MTLTLDHPVETAKPTILFGAEWMKTYEGNLATIKAALVKARELIDYAWYQGDYTGKVPVSKVTSVETRTWYGKKSEAAIETFEVREGFCAAWAIRQGVVHVLGRGDHPVEERAAFEFFARVTGIHNIPMWNDDADRTKEQVLAAFDKVIDAVAA